MSVLQPSELEDSPLADLHAIASELAIEGYRALRRDDLIRAIIRAQAGDAPEPAGSARADERAAQEAAVELEPDAVSAGAAAPDPVAEEPEEGTEAGSTEEADRERDAPAAQPVTGVLDILPNGSGFIRPAGDGIDVYVSPAQIRRCELRAGDEVSGPLRPARRSERHPSLVRVETVNGRDAEPPEQRPRFEDLTAVHPSERLPVPAGLESVPFGKGSRVAVAGDPGAGATRLLRELVATLAADGSELTISVVLIGARPEEVTDWRRGVGVGVAGGGFDRSLEAQAQAAELEVERAKRAVERGGDAVVVLDSLEPLAPGVARRLFGAARKVEEGGSLTIIAATGASADAQRQASTRIGLDQPSEAGEPRVSPLRSGTLRADLL